LYSGILMIFSLPVPIISIYPGHASFKKSKQKMQCSVNF
jgi:hypothetical protein